MGKKRQQKRENRGSLEKSLAVHGSMVLSTSTTQHFKDGSEMEQWFGYRLHSGDFTGEEHGEKPHAVS